MSITSFYGSHIINCAGNGGALAINDEKLWKGQSFYALGEEVLLYLMKK